MYNNLQSAFIAIVLMVTLANFSTQADLYEGSICELHTGETGICKDANRCEWLIRNLKKHKMRYSDIRRCTFTGANEEVVCCGDEHPVKKPIKDNPGPCALGFLFDSYNCVPEITEPVPTITPNVPNKVIGSKLIAACEKYSRIAVPYFPSSIINGIPAGLGEFPHMAALGYPNADNNDLDFDCGGTLISENWVVTAAHCVRDRRRPTVVRLGKLTLHSDDDGLEPIDRNIRIILRHPKYSHSTKRNDIALIEFEGDVELNDLVRPACIRTEMADPTDATELIISGWGSIEADKTVRSKLPLKANLTTVPLERCNQTLLEYNQLSNLPSLRALVDSQMCAVNLVDRRDACQGDSGGPLFLYDSPTGVSTIAGVVSFGVSCGTDLPGVYTRVAAYIDWIEGLVWP